MPLLCVKEIKMTPSEIEKLVLQKIDEYRPSGGLDKTAKLILTLSAINHKPVKAHLERVALLSEKTAEMQNKDTKASFFGGLTHDSGKIVQPHTLFDGHNISAEEYKEVKEHAVSGFQILKEYHEFVGLCAGLHHNVYKLGYGITIDDFPKNWSLSTIKKVLEISTIISICDFIDAATHRATKIMDGSNNKSENLEEMLKNKYPNDIQTIEIALKANNELKL